MKPLLAPRQCSCDNLARGLGKSRMRVLVAFRDGTTDTLDGCTALGAVGSETKTGLIAEYTVTQGAHPNRIITRYPAQSVLFVRSAGEEGDDGG